MNSKTTSNENLLMLIMGAIIILFPLIGFIVFYFIWLELSKESDYIYINGKNLLNFHISYFIYEIIAGISIIIIIGAFLVPIVSIVYFVLSIIGMIKYGFHDDYKYPFAINFIKR